MCANRTGEVIFAGLPSEVPGRPDLVPRARLLELDSEALGQRMCRARHALADHPLLCPEAIAGLANRLPRTAVERHPARQPLLRPVTAPRFARRPSKTVLDLEHSSWSLELRNVERAERYRDLLDALEEVLGAQNGQASLVLSPPLAVTPARVEAEHGLLLQVRGDREVHVGRFLSGDAERRARKRFHRGAQRNLESIPHDPVAIDLDAGDGVYLPPFAPHWIRTGPSASICLSLAFRLR